MNIREEIKVGSNSQFLNSLPGRCRHRLGQRPGSQTVMSFCPEKRTCLATVHAARVPSGILRFGKRKSQHQTVQKNKTQHCLGAVGASTRALSHGHKNLLIKCGDSTLVFWRTSHSDDALSPAREFSVSARSPFTLSTSTPGSPCWRFVSPSLRRVAHGGSCAPLRPLSGSRRDPRACHPSTSSEYP